MSLTLKEKIETIFRLLARPKILKFLLSQGHSGYFIKTGWFKSYISGMPVDYDGEPLPWMTYAFIDFIEPKVNKEFHVFEFGSGNSTLFFSKRAGRVVSVENNKIWYDKISRLIPLNVSLIFQPGEREYCKAAGDKNEFDIIVVDGEDRISCLKNSLKSLKSNGIIILDNSELEIYKPGIDFLSSNNFKRIDFWGFIPGCFYKQCTTIFYRKGNCLGI